MTSNTISTVHILLATYQGAAHLEKQLDTIEAQTHSKWHVHVSDDGSTDETLSIIHEFAARHPGKVTLLKGPGTGATSNFFHLINSCKYCDDTDLFAFCDQDDAWLPRKIAATVTYFDREPGSEIPILYCGRTCITNSELAPIGFTRIPKKPLIFENALTQNIAGGNTMVFNLRLLRILRKIKPEHCVWHDWSAYQATTACGGHVYYDREAYLLYRQHDTNVIGANDGWAQRSKRLLLNLMGRYRQRSDLTELSLSGIENLMTIEAQKTFHEYKLARHAKNWQQRLRHARSAGIFRQRIRENIALYAAVIMKKN